MKHIVILLHMATPCCSIVCNYNSIPSDPIREMLGKVNDDGKSLISIRVMLRKLTGIIEKSTTILASLT